MISLGIFYTEPFYHDFSDCRLLHEALEYKEQKRQTESLLLVFYYMCICLSND